jgi:hypothetical protein
MIGNGVPLYQFDKINGLEGSQRCRWGSFFDQHSHSLLKPGGTIAIEEFDFRSFECDPDHTSWNILFEVWCDAFQSAGGGNLFIGRSLARLLRSAGAENEQVQAHVNLPKVGEYQRTHLLSLIESTRDLMLGPGRLTEMKLQHHMTELAKHLANPETTLIDRLVVQAWGIKPH